MKLTKSLILFAALATSSYGASVSFDVFTDTGVATLAGVKLDSTYTGYIGTYVGSAGQTSNFADINAGFQILATAQFFTSVAPGYLGTIDFGNVIFTDAAGFAGDQLFAWFTNGSDQNALITGFGTIPADNDVPSSKAFGIDESNAAGLTYITGSYDAEVVAEFGGGSVLLNNTAVIPEPSAALLGAIGALGLLRRRRI